MDCSRPRCAIPDPGFSSSTAQVALAAQGRSAGRRDCRTRYPGTRQSCARAKTPPHSRARDNGFFCSGRSRGGEAQERAGHRCEGDRRSARWLPLETQTILGSVAAHASPVHRRGKENPRRGMAAQKLSRSSPTEAFYDLGRPRPCGSRLSTSRLPARRHSRGLVILPSVARIASAAAQPAMKTSHCRSRRGLCRGRSPSVQVRSDVVEPGENLV